MKLRYVGPHDEIEIAATRQIVAQGDTVEVTGEVAKSLIKQGWKRVDKAETEKDEE